MNVRMIRLPIVAFLLVITLAACGQELQNKPTTTITNTPDPGTPVGLTAGMLADRIAAGWEGIERYRAITTSQSIGTPGAIAAGTEVVEEVILPDQRRQMVTMNGVVQSEIISTGGSIYGRGPTLPGISQPNRNPDVWITINGNVLGADNSYSGFYQSLLLPVQPPYSALSAEARARPAEQLEPAVIEGRTCDRFLLVDTTLTGERVEVTLALDEQGRVCSIGTTSAVSATTTIYAYDQPESIEPPASPVPAPPENG